MKILLGCFGTLALSALMLLVYRWLIGEQRQRLAKWKAFCAERTATNAEEDPAANLVNQWLDSTTFADRILITLTSFDMERRGHPKDVARSQAIVVGFSWAGRDRASPTLRSHPGYVARLEELTRVVSGVFAAYRADTEYQGAFHSYFKDSVGEEVDRLLVEVLYREHPSMAAVRAVDGFPESSGSSSA